MSIYKSPLLNKFVEVKHFNVCRNGDHLREKGNALVFTWEKRELTEEQRYARWHAHLLLLEHRSLKAARGSLKLFELEICDYIGP